MSDDYSENYRTELGKLKRAAIDAWVKDQIDTPLTPLLITEADYAWSETIGGTGDMSISTVLVYSISRPGQNGELGGEYSCNGKYDASQTAYYIAMFNSVRVSIDNILSGFDDLPDPAMFQQINTNLDTIVKKLPGKVFGSGSVIPGALLVITEELGKMDSKTISAFRTYLSRLPKVTDNFGLAAESLFATVLGEQELWTRARHDTMELVTSARKAFDKHAKSHAGYGSMRSSLGDLFTVVGAVASAVAAWGPEAGAAAIIAAGIKIIDALVHAETLKPKEITDQNYTGILTALSESVGSPDNPPPWSLSESGLRGNLYLEEERLRSALASNAATVVANIEFGWDLANPYKGKDAPEDLWPSKKMDVEPAQADTIGDELANIYPVLLSARDLLEKSVMDAPWQRPENIGCVFGGFTAPSSKLPGASRPTGTGCYRAWCDLLWALYSRMDDLAVELEDDSIKFPNAVHAIKEHDEAARRQFEQITYIISDDYGHPGLL